MIVGKIDFDGRFQTLTLLVTDTDTGEIVQVENCTFMPGKQIERRTVHVGSAYGQQNLGAMFREFGSPSRRLYLLVCLLRHLVSVVETEPYDLREPYDWLIEQESFRLSLTLEEFVQGYRAIEKTEDTLGDEAEPPSDWLLNLRTSDGNLINTDCIKHIYAQGQCRLQ